MHSRWAFVGQESHRSGSESGVGLAPLYSLVSCSEPVYLVLVQEEVPAGAGTGDRTVLASYTLDWREVRHAAANRCCHCCCGTVLLAEGGSPV